MRITEECANICFADACIEGNLLYAAGFQQNLLLEYNMDSLKLKVLGWIEESIFCAGFRNHAIFKYEESLFCFFVNSYVVAEFNLEQRRFKYYDPEEDGAVSLCSTCRVGNDVWMFQAKEDMAVMVFSMESRQFKICRLNIEGEIEKHSPLSFESSICINRYIWRCIPGSSELLCIDTEKMNGYVRKLDVNIQFQSMTYDNKVLYILSMDGRYLVVFNPASDETMMYETGYDGLKELPFTEAVKNGNDILLLPCFEQEIFCYKIQRDELSFVRHLKMPERFKKLHDIEHRSLFLRWKKQGGKLLLFPFAGSGMLSVDWKSLDLDYYSIRIPEKSYLKRLLRTNSVCREGEAELKDILSDIVCGSKIDTFDMKSELKSQGRAIWDAINCDGINGRNTI